MDVNEALLERWRRRQAKRIRRREAKARAIEAWQDALDRSFGVKPERKAFETIFQAAPERCPF